MRANFSGLSTVHRTRHYLRYTYRTGAGYKLHSCTARCGISRASLDGRDGRGFTVSADSRFVIFSTGHYVDYNRYIRTYGRGNIRNMLDFVGGRSNAGTSHPRYHTKFRRNCSVNGSGYIRYNTYIRTYPINTLISSHSGSRNQVRVLGPISAVYACYNINYGLAVVISRSAGGVGCIRKTGSSPMGRNVLYIGNHFKFSFIDDRRHLGAPLVHGGNRLIPTD